MTPSTELPRDFCSGPLQLGVVLVFYPFKKQIIIDYQSLNELFDLTLNKHNAELQRTAPDTQDTEAFSTRGRLFFFLTFMFF